MRSKWTEERLAKLFDHYNRLYWRGHVPAHTLNIGSPPDGEKWIGLCVRKTKTIIIDVAQHSSDREIRSTLLHEMAHAASRGDRLGHGYKFWEQVEMLLEKNAPISVGMPEAPHLRIFANSIPKRMRLSRKKMERLAAQRQRQIEGWMARHPDTKTQVMTDEDIVTEFKDCAIEPKVTWQQALFVVGGLYGLVDVGGGPVNRWAARILHKAKRVFHAERREQAEAEKMQALYFDFLPEWKNRHPGVQDADFTDMYAEYRAWCGQKNIKALGLQGFRQCLGRKR